MTKHVIQAEGGAPPLGAYSHGWRAGGFIYITGTGPIGPDGKVVGETIEEQTHQAIDNVAAVLKAEGAALSDVIKVSVHLSDTNLFGRYDAAYRERFSPPYPARTTVGSDLHQVPGMLIEIEAVAFVGD
jgi:2-iminobutanoate/2-iminopropanoate deaminase